MNFKIKYKDIRYDTIRDVFVFDTTHPESGKPMHIEKAPTEKTEYDLIASQIDTLVKQIEVLHDTIIDVDIPTPFDASITKKRTVVNEQSYSETTTVEEIK